MQAITHIADTFTATRAAGRAALMPYFTLGFPDPATSLDILEAIAHSGADLIELGVPFSDPLADGPTIQHSTQVALEQGITVSKCLELVAGLRQRQVTQPLFLMGYYNPILAYGVTRYVDQAQAAGADGFIVPDLPPEEANEMEAACRQNDCALVYLLAPTSPIDRARQIAARTTGFLYLVSLTGVTGARKTLPSDLAGFIQEARQVARTPIAVGFGISTPEQAASVGSLADGVIVGSALIDVVTHSQQPCHAASGFISALRSALQE